MTLLRKNELFQTHIDIEWNNTLEGVEKYITSKIYGNNVAFAPSQRHRKMDERISNKIHKLSDFIQPKHLDVKDIPIDISEEHWEASASEIRKMNEFKSPRDKLVCILNCCRIVTFLLTKAASETGKQPGADEFLTALIYAVIRANPENLYSNVEYVLHFFCLYIFFF